MAGFTPIGSSLVGTDANDTLLVEAGDATIRLYTSVIAKDGNDQVSLVAPSFDPLTNLLINLNKGDDTLYMPSAAACSIFGGAGNDVLELSRLNNCEIRGGAGNDTILLIDTPGNSLINGNLGDDSISAESTQSAAALSGGAGNDTLLGGIHADTLTPGAGSDSVLAGDGDDLLLLGSLEAGDVIDGGEGTNRLRWQAAGGDLSVATLRSIQQLELAPGGSGDTYTIAQGLSSGSPLLITGGGIATGEADQLRIRQAASSGAFSLAQSAGGDLLTYTDAITGSPVTITFANSSGGSVRTEGGDLLYTSSTGGGGGAILNFKDIGPIESDRIYNKDSSLMQYWLNTTNQVSQPNYARLTTAEVEVEFGTPNAIALSFRFRYKPESQGLGDTIEVSRLVILGIFTYLENQITVCQVDTIATGGALQTEGDPQSLVEALYLTNFLGGVFIPSPMDGESWRYSLSAVPDYQTTSIDPYRGSHLGPVNGSRTPYLDLGNGQFFQEGWYGDPFTANLI